MFDLPEAWVWDFWIVDDGDRYHLFFLYASRALKDPEARHYRASVGHAVSDDLSHWTRVTDALVRSDAPAADDLATWTGSITRGPDGLWYLIYTSATAAPNGSNVQTISYATSPDLYDWTKAPGPVLRADPRWYERLADGLWNDEAFRDPCVLPDPDGDGWHLLITARANRGAADDRGVIGHATSPDLRRWTLQPPLSQPGQGFGQLEVPDPVVIEGRHFLLFNCLDRDVSAARRATGTRGGVWLAPAEGPLGPYDIAGAQLLADRRHYVGRIVTDRSGAQVFLAFRHDGPDGDFLGGIIDPVPIAVRDGRVVLPDFHPSASAR
ncbi:MAG: family 43 glycosylhydrolase [Micropruina sp.]|uniref:family 43 glycosylhydrolase n=1 Tax=Micropruina sp. TaxID=2737536 RepID=UPI0039E486E2